MPKSMFRVCGTCHTIFNVHLTENHNKKQKRINFHKLFLASHRAQAAIVIHTNENTR